MCTCKIEQLSLTCRPFVTSQIALRATSNFYNKTTLRCYWLHPCGRLTCRRSVFRFTSLYFREIFSLSLSSRCLCILSMCFFDHMVSRPYILLLCSFIMHTALKLERVKPCARWNSNRQFQRRVCTDRLKILKATSNLAAPLARLIRSDSVGTNLYTVR